VDRQNPQTIARVFSWLFVATFVTSIPAYFILYAPVRDNPGLIPGTGADPTTSVGLGAVLEVFLIVANVGTAVVIYPILKRQSEIGAVSYLSARIVENIFIAIGIISLLAFLLMRQQATAGTDAGLGEALVAIHDRAFLIGPGFFAGLTNGVILGYLMYRSGLVPRGSSSGSCRSASTASSRDSGPRLRSSQWMTVRVPESPSGSDEGSRPGRNPAAANRREVQPPRR
jgi:hypothetical protein